MNEEEEQIAKELWLQSFDAEEQIAWQRRRISELEEALKFYEPREEEEGEKP